ncbi:MAG TPA: TolC family protein, partial [Candidatus Cloacimonadota bacterium]|nr:TolC family protein [Candidatus Cloacimonadota bacterium]
MKKKYFVLFASILAFSLAAQTSLSLQDCLDLARQNNKDLLKAKEDVAIYRQEYNQVRGNLLPQITLSGGYQFKQTRIPDSSLLGFKFVDLV